MASVEFTFKGLHLLVTGTYTPGTKHGDPPDGSDLDITKIEALGENRHAIDMTDFFGSDVCGRSRVLSNDKTPTYRYYDLLNAIWQTALDNLDERKY